MGEEKTVRPESRGGRVELRPGPLSDELRKPLVFGNHQRHFKVFTAAVTAALTYYLVFHHDFGPQRHVFSWIREVKERKKREFFHIDPEDDELRRVREQQPSCQCSVLACARAIGHFISRTDAELDQAMEEVRPGLLLGSMGDAMAVVSRVSSITKQYTVTHILTLGNQPPDWLSPEWGVAGSGDPEAKDESASEGSEVGEGDRTCAGAKSEGTKDAGVPSGGGGIPFKTMYVCVADMPTADLLHHFEPCAKFIKEGVEQGTILVHCEYGISRSATVVLAYLMWSECLPLKMALQDLKARKPGIRPNAGFMEQLQLWERMRCQLDNQNKAYRVYRLKLKAHEMKEMGYVESVTTSPDPAQTALDSTAYFRCRKCRRLLFTGESVLQHELGGGQAAFKWHKRSRQDPLPPTYGPGQGTVAGQTVAALSDGKTGSPVEDTVEERGEGSLDGFREIETALTDLTLEGGRATTSLGTGTAPDSPNGRSSEQSPQNQDTDGKEPKDHVTTQEPEAPLGHPSISPPLTPTTPPPLTPTELAKVRAQVASVVALDNQSPAHVSQACSSYFIEPVEWMESALLGSVEGKILCPKCSAKLGSFNWSGEQCSCGQWVTPSFQVHRSRVDETRTLTRRKGHTGPPTHS